MDIGLGGGILVFGSISRAAMSLLIGAVSTTVVASPAHAARGDDPARFPTRAVTLVVPFATGGANDAIARALAARLSARWEQPVVVENIGGAGGLIGTNRVISAPPDGHVLLLQNPALLMLPMLHRNVEPARTLQPIAPVAYSPAAMVVPARLPVRTVKDLLEHCRQASPPCSVASADPLGGAYGRRLMKEAGIETATHVSYRGTSPVVADLRGGVVSLGMTTLSAPLPHHASGALRIIGVGTNGPRAPQLPEVPTLAEQGFGDFLPALWTGVFAHADVPPRIVARIDADVRDARSDPDLLKVLAGAGAVPATEDRAAFARVLAGQDKTFRELLRQFPIVQ